MTLIVAESPTPGLRAAFVAYVDLWDGREETRGVMMDAVYASGAVGHQECALRAGLDAFISRGDPILSGSMFARLSDIDAARMVALVREYADAFEDSPDLADAISFLMLCLSRSGHAAASALLVAMRQAGFSYLGDAVHAEYAHWFGTGRGICGGVDPAWRKAMLALAVSLGHQGARDDMLADGRLAAERRVSHARRLLRLLPRASATV